MERSRQIALAAALAIALACQTQTDEPTPITQDPESAFNVVIIVSDALRQDALSCYGGQARTPHIDELANRGVLFENAYSTSPWTGPSSVSMLCGSYATSYAHTPSEQATRHKPSEVYVPSDELLVLEALEQLGYATAMMSENAYAVLHNNVQGLDEIKVRGRLSNYLPDRRIDEIERITGGEMFRVKPYINAFLVLEELLSLPEGRNFAVLYWMLDPHHPYKPVDKFKSRIKVNQSKLTKKPGYYEVNRLGDSWMTEIDRQYVIDLYEADIESADERVGFVLSALAHMGQLDNTYVIFTSDHGEQFGQHGLYGHGGFGNGSDFYEGLLRVPLIIAGPGIPSGLRIDERVQLIDLMPTLQELLGLECDTRMQGRSLVPVIHGEQREQAPLYFDDVKVDDHIDGLIEGNFKLICRQDGTYELYDLGADPEESRNLAADESHRVCSMFNRVLEFRVKNERRRKKSATALQSSLDSLDANKRDKIIRQLRSLGYIN